MRQQRVAGSIPPHHRRLALVVAVSFFVVLGACGLLVRFVVGVPVPWIWLIVTPLFATALVVLYLWVRLSD